MFDAAIHVLVEYLGHDTLTGVRDLASASNAKNLQVVIKKNRRWFWQKPKYFVTNFQLREILTNHQELSVKSDKCKFVSYQREKTFDIKGEIGAKLCEEIVNVTLDASDAVIFSADCGELDKDEVNIPELLGVLKTKRLNFKHPVCEQVTENKLRVLCVIVKVISLVNEGSLHSKIDYKNTASMEAKLPLCKSTDVSASAEFDEDKEKFLKIPPGTPLAYAVCELIISTSGLIDLAVVPGVYGCFDAPDSHDGGCVAEVVPEKPVMEHVFRGYMGMSAKEKDAMRGCLLCTMSNSPSLRPIIKQLRNACKYREYSSIQDGELEQMIPSENMELLKSFVGLSGVVHKVEGSQSATTEAIFSSRKCLLDLLNELSNNILVTLARHDNVTGCKLLQLLKNREQEVTIEDTKLDEILKLLGFEIEKGSAVPPTDTGSLYSALWLCYILWG